MAARYSPGDRVRSAPLNERRNRRSRSVAPPDFAVHSPEWTGVVVKHEAARVQVRPMTAAHVRTPDKLEQVRVRTAIWVDERDSVNDNRDHD